MTSQRLWLDYPNIPGPLNRKRGAFKAKVNVKGGLKIYDIFPCDVLVKTTGMQVTGCVSSASHEHYDGEVGMAKSEYA